MNDFVFYKKRDFGMLISDTFVFFRKYAKNFFSNYLLINGALFILIGVIAAFMFIFYGVYSNNWPLLLLILAVLGVLSAFLVLFVICFPIAYTQLLEKNADRSSIKAKELFVVIRKMLPRAILFGIISFFIILIPYFILILVLARIFGHQIILMQIASYFAGIVMILFMQQFMLVYVKDGLDYFPALRKVIQELKERFWDKLGATFVMNLIITAFSAAGIVVPLVLYFTIMLLIGIDSLIGLSLLIFTLVLIGATVVFIVSNFQIFLQILIHLGEKEEEHTDDIDLIGKHVEE
jgi:putative membrane protein